MELLLGALRAAAEPTRLRILALCGHGELTVSELTQILGQSQPRVSRHLKLLCEAGLLERFREGTWAFFRLAEHEALAGLARTLIAAIPADDRLSQLDLQRLEAVKRARAEAAAAYFSENAARWHEIRSLHVPEQDVEKALLNLVPQSGIHDLLDIGTGTGRMLELFSTRVMRAVGVDLSREMLAIARDNLARADLRHCQVRQADMYQLPLPDAAFDLVLLHQVLHFAENPARAISEAARVLRPNGRLLIIDFAPHKEDWLLEQHAHRHPGFAETEVFGWLAQAGLTHQAMQALPGAPLTVGIWSAIRPGTVALQATQRATELMT